MNSDKRKSNGGNALIYILLALALLGGLTMIIANQNNSSSNDNLDSENTELLSTSTIAFATSAKNAVDQMLFGGTLITSLDYSRPGDTNYNSGVHRNQVFHPEGGGISIDAIDTNVFSDTGTTPKAGWYMGRFNNFDWTPTTANDIVLSAFGISQALCANINKKITGNTTIPAIGNSSNIAQYFVSSTVTGAPANANFTIATTVCPSCEGYPALCVSNQAGTQWAYYNIISGQ